jgi:hypothetical protein
VLPVRRQPINRTNPIWFAQALFKAINKLHLQKVSLFRQFEKRLGSATTLYGTVALSFVIPSEAEGSAVPRTSPGNANTLLKQNCHLDWSVPGFPATRHWKRARLRLSVRKAA